MTILYLLAAFILGWFLIKLFVGILRIVLVIILIAVLVSMAMSDGRIGFQSTTQGDSI